MAGVREAQQRDVSDAACVKAAGWRDSYARLVPAPVLAPFTLPSLWMPKVASLLGHLDSFFLVDTADGEVRGLAHGSVRACPPGVAAHPGGAPGAWHRAGVDARGAGRVRARGARSLHFDVVSGNDRALRIYRRLGGVDLGTHPAGWALEVTETSLVFPDAPPSEREA
jgi:hypothetical protein